MEDNRWLSCRCCNEFKGKQTGALDSTTGGGFPYSTNPESSLEPSGPSWLAESSLKQQKQ